MTTTVFDGSVGLLTSDSRWSIDTDHAVYYVDDTGFDKIEAVNEFAFLFAGASNVINEWKVFLRGDQSGDRPPLQGIALLIVEISSGKSVYSYQQDISLDERKASFAGSGARFAYLCWNSNSCARRAVSSAKNADVYSGGEVKFLELGTGDHNLNNCTDLTEMSKIFLEKGMVRYAPNEEPIPVKDAAANDARVKELCNKIANGSLPLSAPCDGMYNLPSEDDERSLDHALELVFKKKFAI